jgi:hypothetical protein
MAPAGRISESTVVPEVGPGVLASVDLAKEADRAIRYVHRNDLPAHRAGLHRADNRQMRLPLQGRSFFRRFPALHP